jgi:hypothetical protein
MGGSRRTRKRTLPHVGESGIAPILGAGIEIQQDHRLAVQQTSDYRISINCMKDYRRRIKFMIAWIETEYSEYYEQGTIQITAQQKGDPSLHFFHHERDFKYSGMNVEVVKAFLSVHKTKENGKHCSQVHLRKYHDAIQFGAEEVRQALPQQYFVEMDAFLDASKKEVVTHRRAGNLDEQEADPISFPLFQLICEWALASRNVFLWVWTILQWNNMARSISIDPLGFHNFSIGVDSIKCKYDDSKADKKGERVSPKNIYANPFNPMVCPHLSLGCWFALRKGTFGKNDSFFLGAGQPGSAAHRYCDGLSKLLTEYMEKVMEFIRPGHANTHGIRKGCATFSTSGTTFPASLVAVSKRGEWTQGSVFDIYFQFAETGDQYLGRLIVGLDPNSPDFDVLPPHFKGGTDNDYIQRAMELCFGPIIKEFNATHSVKGLLLLCLASMVYHSEFLKSFVVKDPEHPFSLIPILNDTCLLSKLKELVTLEGDDTMRATGIPPHVRQTKLLQEVLGATKQLQEAQLKELGQIKEAIKQAIQENDVQAGNVTLPSLLEGWALKQKESLELIKKTMEETLDNRLKHLGLLPQIEPAKNAMAMENEQYTYCYSGFLWDVPEGYQFPKKALRDTGWELWLRGQPNLEIHCPRSGQLKITPIKPFRLLKPNRLPVALKKKFELEWKPIFAMMEEAPDLTIPAGISVLSPEFIQESFIKGTAYLKSRASYIGL